MAISARCVLREGNYCAAIRVRWLIISIAFIPLCDESRAETGPVRCALGQMKKGRGAAA